VLGDGKKILFVTGKGGVGKSLIAAAVALEQAGRGRRVLLVEIGESSYYKDFWKLAHIGHEPVKLPLGFDLALWSGETCLREYVLFYLRMQRLYQLFFENKVMRALVNVAPGLSEIAILGKITSGIRKVGPAMEYDLIVVDCYATGHALALLRTPKGMHEAIKYGPMGAHSRDIQAVLQNPELCEYAIVSLLEELPVSESLELKASLAEELQIRALTVANRFMPIPVNEEQLQGLSVGKSAVGIAEFSNYLLEIEKRQSKFLVQLGETAARVPLIFSSEPSDLITQAGEALRTP
jgi:hypothetical protein